MPESIGISSASCFWIILGFLEAFTMHNRSRRDAGNEFWELDLDDDTDVTDWSKFRGETPVAAGGITPAASGFEEISLSSSGTDGVGTGTVPSGTTSESAETELTQGLHQEYQ